MPSPRFALLTAAALGLSITAQAAKLRGSIPTHGLKKEDYPEAAKVSLGEAVAAALQRIPGKATEAELEGEGGFLVFEVKVMGADHRRAKVYVDAGTKEILAPDAP